MTMKMKFTFVLPLLAAAGLTGCGDGSSGGPIGAAPLTELSAAAALGAKIFADPSLSASGRLSCTTCHDPARAHASNAAVIAGGPNLTTPGFRNPPSLRYIDQTPAFAITDDGALGGFDRDGRVASLAEQARQPLLAAHEMANISAANFANRLQQTTYAAEFRRVFGNTVFDDPQTALDRATFALQRYQLEDDEFHPYDSKYDAFLQGRAQLSAQELRGLQAFNDPQKGNCTACHPGNRGAGGSSPLFTDFHYDNLGVPRNNAIPATADPAYYDLGLCGPDREDLKDRLELCGQFKTPTLRNIALTAPYFHNGRFATLREAVAFYVQRDTSPQFWYPLADDGSVRKFDDVPGLTATGFDYRTIVNIEEVPYDRRLGEQPRLTESEIDDVVAFLNTLNDGYQP
jgi:cytochrome c peroxidase